MISNCWIYGNYDAISAFQSNNCTIKACEIYQNTNDGISMQDSTGSIITENTIHGHLNPQNSDGVILEGMQPGGKPQYTL